MENLRLDSLRVKDAIMTQTLTPSIRGHGIEENYKKGVFQEMISSSRAVFQDGWQKGKG